MFWSWIRKFDEQSSNKLKIYNQSFFFRPWRKAKR